MRASIMQPTYLPWPGYFGLISNSDYFVFLDDVQFEKRSWQSRNCIYSENGEMILSIPVVTKGKRYQRIFEVELFDFPKHRAIHLETLKRVYSKSPHFSEVYEVVQDGMQLQKPFLLADLNKRLVLGITKYLNLDTQFINSSEVLSSGQRSEKLIQILMQLGAKTYLAPNGSKDYMLADSHLWKPKIQIEVQTFNQKPYFHFRDRYASNRSILDLLFNLSVEQARNYIENCNEFHKLLLP